MTSASWMTRSTPIASTSFATTASAVGRLINAARLPPSRSYVGCLEPPTTAAIRQESAHEVECRDHRLLAPRRASGLLWPPHGSQGDGFLGGFRQPGRQRGPLGPV